MNVLAEARKVFGLEMKALERTRALLNQSFTRTVTLCRTCKGKVILTGIGKSGIIAQKIAATMSSTGTLAVYLHPAEGLHGDLGIIHADDVVIAVGKSGESEELAALIPVVRRIGAKLVAITGEAASVLGKNADVVIDASVEKEACHLNLAPTCSTTTALVIGDALAVVLSKQKKFREEDFALYHPGGTLGKRLVLTVGDLMHGGKDNPVVGQQTPVNEVLIEMTRSTMGAVNVTDGRRKLVGIITDGDLRRQMQKYKDGIFSKQAKDIMTRGPVTVTEDEFAYEALKRMENRKSQIKELPVVSKTGRSVGIIRLHDLVQAGL